MKPAYEKQNVERERPRKVNAKSKKTINGCIKRLRSVGKRVTSTSLLANCRLRMSRSSVQCSLRQSKYRCKQVRQSVSLSETEKAKRIEVVKNWIFQGISFSKVVFTDEKRFCLYGPDNYYSWINGDEHLTRQKRHSVGGGLMIYGFYGLNASTGH